MKRNPNGYGCVTKLTGNRARPYVIKITIYDENARSRQVPIGYAATRTEGLTILAQYNNSPWNIDDGKLTLLGLYRRWEKSKLPALSPSLQGSLRAAFGHCKKYYGVRYRSLRAFQMQDCIDSCSRSYSTKAAIKNLFGHLDRFAFELDIIDKMYSQLLTSPPIPETKRRPFTPAQTERLWELSSDGDVQTVLIYMYTGLRLNELLEMKCSQVNVAERYLRGGKKTRAGRDRIIPIHPRIWPFIESRLSGDEDFLLRNGGDGFTPGRYYRVWNRVMKILGADKTPHEARHTFETNLDNVGANRKCIDLLMGHKSPDIGNRVYNHKTLDQLREAIELLP